MIKNLHSLYKNRHLRFSKYNFYLFNLVLTFFGVLCLIINAKNMIHLPGLLFFSIILMIFPSIIITMYFDSIKINPVYSILLIIIPLIFINYIFYITQAVPVGIGDPHFHIYRTLNFLDDNSKINFLDTQFNTISGNFMGLYLIYDMVLKISNQNIAFLASFIPPLMNLILILCVYIIANRLHSHKIALSVLIIYGWEYLVIILGQEIRTQTLGTLLLFSFLAILVIINKDGKKFNYSIILIILLFGVVLSSFASIVYTFLILFSMFSIKIILIIFKKLNKKNLPDLAYPSILLLLFFIFYLLYIGNSFEFILKESQILITNFLNPFSTFGDSLLKSVSSIFPAGWLSKYATYIFYLIFGIFTLYYLILIIKNKYKFHLVFFCGFIPVGIFFILSNYLPLMSSGRLYVILLLLLAIALSFGIFYLINRYNKSVYRKQLKFLISLLILIYVIVSIVKLPNYVIGETLPIRSVESIDSIDSWNADIPQYSVTDFLNNYSGNQFIESHMSISNYYFLLYRYNLSSRNLGYLVLLHDKFYGENYTTRDKLPIIQEFTYFNKIYDNSDYLIFRRI